MSYKEYTIRIHDTGTREYFNKTGQYHREDGPACEYADGSKFWYINGKHLTKAKFLARTRKAECDGKVVEIEGKKYRLIAE